MKINELANTAIIHSLSRRALHNALRFSAPDSANDGCGCRRRASNRTISAARATMVTKKNHSLLIIGPIRDISLFEEGRTPNSESSCNPETNNCAATKNRITVVTRKNFCRLILTVPFTNITPNSTAANTPSNVPRKLCSALDSSETAERISTVSAPSRNTIRNTKRKTPNCDPRPASDPILLSISPLSLRPAFIMKITMVTTKTAAASITQPSNKS